jgi:predicted peroxiredoxin
MPDKLLIMMTSGPESRHRLGTPFFQAMAATALDYEAVIVTLIDGTLLLKKGVAETLTIKDGETKTVLDFIREAKAAGARLFVCPASLSLHDLTLDDLIPEVDGAMGAARYTEMALSDECRVFCY